MLAALLLAQAVTMPGCSGALCDADRLRPVFAKLREARAGHRVVRILQIGDSHTAGDQVTGSWRTLLQARYGSAGRGVLPPGRPYQGYLTRGITASQTGAWSVDGIFGAPWHGGAGQPKGLPAYTLSTVAEGAGMSLAADAGELFDRFTVCALRAPGAGTLTLAAGQASATMALGEGEPGPACTSVSAGALADTASITAGGGPVSITSWATERSDGGGVVLSNLGTVGAQLVHFERTDERVIRAELAAYRPDLLVVEFGTNEAFMPGFSASTYESLLRADVSRLKRLAPGVPMLLIGAPDSATKQASIRGSATCGASVPAPVARPGELVQPLPIDAASAWAPTAALPQVQAIQARVAHEAGLAFWNWSQAMGGRCTATIWAAATPPLMRGDRVHFTSAGGAEIARRLEADWEAAEMGRAAPPLPGPPLPAQGAPTGPGFAGRD